MAVFEMDPFRGSFVGDFDVWLASERILQTHVQSSPDYLIWSFPSEFFSRILISSVYLLCHLVYVYFAIYRCQCSYHVLVFLSLPSRWTHAMRKRTKNEAVNIWQVRKSKNRQNKYVRFLWSSCSWTVCFRISYHIIWY